MAKRLFFAGNQTYNALAYTTPALTASQYMGLAGGSATQLIDVLEVLVSGMASNSIVAAMQLVRSSGTVFATPTALASPNSDGPQNPATAALAAPPISFVAAGTNPNASATTTDAKLNLALNLFGGIIRWNAAPSQQWTILGNASGLGNSLLFNSLTSGGQAGGGVADAHILYEPY
jgi:hypothetical protein